MFITVTASLLGLCFCFTPIQEQNQQNMFISSTCGVYQNVLYHCRWVLCSTIDICKLQRKEASNRPFQDFRYFSIPYPGWKDKKTSGEFMILSPFTVLLFSETSLHLDLLLEGAADTGEMSPSPVIPPQKHSHKHTQHYAVWVIPPAVQLIGMTDTQYQFPFKGRLRQLPCLFIT